MVVRMLTNLKILKRFWKATIIQSMEYRTSFLFSILANFMDFTFGLLQYLLFFTAAKSIAGWATYEMLTLYAVFMNVFALHFIFLYPNLVAMGEMVNTGNLDMILTKPVSAQLILSFRRISLEELGSLFTANFLLFWLAYNGKLILTLATIAQFLTAIFCSLTLIYCLFLLLISAAIKMEKLDNMSQLMWSLFSFCRYPTSVYPKWLRAIFFSFFPIAFISTVPAKALLGTADWNLILSGLSVSVIALFISKLLWNQAIKGYTSAGG